MDHPLLKILESHKQGKPVGIYSVCSANPYVLNASVMQTKSDNSYLLIESTSNQVNQYGGYTGQKPKEFKKSVDHIIQSFSMPKEKIILGGDHLGPNPWKNQTAEDAMKNAEVLVKDYIAAGYTKIHLDTSMYCKDDIGNRTKPLDNEIVASRAAKLCSVAEQTWKDSSNKVTPLYVIGTEVPVPGGSQRSLSQLDVTSIEDIKETIEIFKYTFKKNNLDDAWERVIAVVVQPGVEFSNEDIIDYKRDKAEQLSKFIEKIPNMVFEIHSTDYQKPYALKQLVEDHFAILKVGPALTFAFREAVIALSFIEEEWLAIKKNDSLSRIKQIVDNAMKENPKYWEKYYNGEAKGKAFFRRYSFSDRIRYYWSQKKVKNALSQLFDNLEKYPPPLPLISQYFPVQYRKIRNNNLKNKPIDIVYDKIRERLADYSKATGQFEKI
ncbi:MAG: D-tagatose-bisphosphate aldolase, class II, non-catalytic subunit [bacterium]